MVFVPGHGYKWFPYAKKFSDLSWHDIERWMRQHMTERERDGFKAALVLEKKNFAAARAAGQIGWIATEIFWPRGLSEALMHDFPVEFAADYASSRNAITKNFERVLGPFVIAGKYASMQATT